MFSTAAIQERKPRSQEEDEDSNEQEADFWEVLVDTFNLTNTVFCIQRRWGCNLELGMPGACGSGLAWLCGTCMRKTSGLIHNVPTFYPTFGPICDSSWQGRGFQMSASHAKMLIMPPRSFQHMLVLFTYSE